MAFALPILLTLVMGIISYGDWFLTAHTVQQAANDAARAAIAGLTSTERRDLATNMVTTMLARGGTLNPSKATISVSDDPVTTQTFSVQISYDASLDPLLHMSFIAPPNPQIRRTAAISLGGM